MFAQDAFNRARDSLRIFGMSSDIHRDRCRTTNPSHCGACAL
jgi:hypothetical protein